MIRTPFYVVTKLSGGISWDHSQNPGEVVFHGNKVQKLIPPKHLEINDLYGKILYSPDYELEDFFIILRNKRIFPLPIDKYGIETISKIVDYPEFAYEADSLKMIISFVRL